jgi:hypothetical protein
MESNKFIGVLVQSRIIVKLRHWKTTSDVEHRYLDEYYNATGDIVDSFTEKLQGHMGGRLDIQVPASMPTDPIPHLKEIKRITTSVRDNYPTDLQNILDELLGVINETLLLLSLK